MITEDQHRAIEFLNDPASYGLFEPVQVMETHISMIFLVGNRAFKMKRAVKLPYVDFSTADLRLAACEKEVALNSVTAPGLYLGVRRIASREDGSLCFSAGGPPVEAVVEMVRFDQSCLFDRMAVSGTLTPALMTEVARQIAQFHATAPVVTAESGSANLAGVLDINEAGFATSHVFDAEEIKSFAGRFRKALQRHAHHLDRRAAASKIRRCHGDLHLRNICLFEGAPRLFDCIEFNDQIATVDVLYDLAFLLMDLWHRGLRQFANLVMNRYLDETGDEDGFCLLPFFMAVRAAVRAHVTATQAQEGGENSQALIATARSYFELAHSLLDEQPPRLIAIGGLSGSGKSTVAVVLSPEIGSPPGARLLESDRIRKAMFGVDPETRLGPDAYQPDVSAKVYRALRERAGAILSSGGSVVADAVFDRADNRALMEKAASDHSVRFTGIWLDADPATLLKRVEARVGGSSDATVEVLKGQLERASERIDWRRLNAEPPAAETAREIRNLLVCDPESATG
ncbi:AAA family ATPase [Pseudaminobacter soli (ex Li et al. 2025)]|uniref:Aminoglycoside phosphotransferase n=1 Tax=Pseudaminobacter soli (ex Li et al. 2025) TaxID=1295366 RepID=A0A2P7SG66_9HYPH|nr:bifunctional aminoglycoside phosphotransferase/ATP-binding protein [Mesorhizobium soli]PSJ61489.1 aminoglycoside phosphotransferase [Mesorhizobium soli]